MSEWSDALMKGATARIVDHGNGVLVHGSGEPLLSILDVLGYELRDMFVIGFNDKCGSVVVPDEARAGELATLMNAAYKTENKRLGPNWSVTYDQRNLDGSVDSHLLVNVTLKDGRQVIRDGKWVN